jgi:hypothetical protein
MELDLEKHEQFTMPVLFFDEFILYWVSFGAAPLSTSGLPGCSGGV